MADSPEEDLEIIETTDIPTDPNANTNAVDIEDIEEQPIDINKETLDIEQETIQIEEEKTLNTEEQLIDDQTLAIDEQTPNINDETLDIDEQKLETEQEPVDTSLLTQLSPTSALQSQPDLAALSTIQNDQNTQDAENEADNADMFIPLHDPNNITKPTDTTIHNKTKSEATGFDMFSFFKVEGDSDDDDDDEEDSVEPQSKRAESMTGLSKLQYEELNIENLRQFNANTARDTDNEDDGEDIEEKEAQPMNKIADDGHSVTSQHGSIHSQPDISAEPHTAIDEAQINDTTAPVVEENIDTMPTGGIPMGIVTPSFLGNKRESHSSIHKIPNVLHTDSGHRMEEAQNDVEYHGRDRSATTIRHGDAIISNNVNVDGYGMVMDNEEDIVIEDEYTYDIEANDNDDIIESNPQHVTRRSIAEMVDDALEEEINTADINTQDMAVIGSDDEAMGLNDHQNWMETAKQWMLKEKHFQEEIMDLEEELERQDALAREMEIDFEKKISRSEEEKNDLIASYEEQVENLHSDHRLETDKLSADNTTMARDVEFLTTEVSEQKQQIDELESDIAELTETIGYKENEWNVHQQNCPLLNEEIAKTLEEKRTEQVQKYRSKSQQMDASLGEMLTENKTQEDTIIRLKDDKQLLQRQIEDRNVEIDRLNSELDTIKTKYNRNLGAVDEQRHRADEEQRHRVELEQELSRIGNEYDMLMAYSNEQSQVLDMAEFAPTGVDPEKFEMIRNKRSLFVADKNSGRGRSFVQSMGGFSEFAEHMRTISNMTDALQSGAAMFRSDLKQEDDHDHDASSQYSSSVATSVDVASIASNWTRYSFQRYHTHDASREFFFLLALCVKLSLAQKYGISPDIAPTNDNLWKQALANNIKFHEYYDFLLNELANLYEFKYKSQQGTIHSVVITDITKIRHKQEHNEKVNKLQKDASANGYLYNQYENYAKGKHSTQNRLNDIRDRTVFNPNDDIFGGNIKITTRSNRSLNLENHRSSISRQSSQRSARRKSKRKSHRHSHHHSKRKHMKKKPQMNNNNNSIEPGTDRHHPLRNDDSKRDSEKLTTIVDTNLNKSVTHLTQKSLEALDPAKNPSL